MLREYEDTKEEIKSSKTSTVHQRFLSVYNIMLSYCLKYRRNTESKTSRVAKKIKKVMLLSKFVVYDSKKNQDLLKNSELVD